MDQFGSFSTTFRTKTSNLGGARFGFQQKINANLAQWPWGIDFFNMHGNAPIKVMLHIYFNFEYVKFINYETNKPHDGAFVFNAL